MKSILITLAGWLVMLQSLGQCNSAFTIFSNPQACANLPIVFNAVGTTDCPGPFEVQYTWWTNQLFNNSSFQTVIGSVTSGTALSTTSIPIYTPPTNGPGQFQANLTVAIIDNMGDTISFSETTSGVVTVLPPITVWPFVSNNQCGQNNCASVQVTGGTAPYTFSWNGISSPQSTYCFDSPGVYSLQVADVNGCVSMSDVVIQPSAPTNNSCDTALPLTDGVTTTDTICFSGAATAACSNTTYYQAGWYTIASGNNQYLHVGLGSTLPGTSGAINYNAAVEVYEASATLDCDSLTLIQCIAGNNCSALSSPITVNPNSTYYIRVLTQWTSWMVVNIVVEISAEPITEICGCTNNTSCNYDPNAIINDGSCGWNGCMDQNACNYVSYATCDDGSCIYGNDFTGQLFNDINGDGVRNTSPTLEPALGNIGSIYIVEANITVMPNAQGNFVIPSLPLGTYTITFTDPNGYWQLNTNGTLNITLPTCNGLNIPLSPVSGAAANVYPSSAWLWSNFHCNNGFYPGVTVQNTGTVALNASFTIQFDPSLLISSTNSTVNAVVNNGNATFQLNNLAPGATAYLQLHVNGPGVNFVGQTYAFTGAISLTDVNGNMIYENSFSRNAVVTCAYDPNDKSASPEGYEEPHFILADTEIEYRIRFQNTGNAPAFDVVIEDQIDVEHLDIATLVPTGASHSYSTIIEPSGRVRFVFNNIMLPDSVHNEPESHGYITYKIRPRSDIMEGAVIENTASIFFDDNPPIITNTTMHTIYSCDWWQSIGGEVDQCAELTFSLIDFSFYVEHYTWSINGEIYVHPNPLVNPYEFIFQTDTPGDYEIGLTRTNPLCSTTQFMTVHVRPVPEAVITENNGTLSTNADGNIFQWYLNNQAITGATDNSYTPTASGNYQVVVSNEWFCNDTSLPYNFTFIGVNETTAAQVSVYPNPVQDELRAALPAGQYKVTVLNAQGSMVQESNNVNHLGSISTAAWAKGIYHLRFADAAGITYRATVVKQ